MYRIRCEFLRQAGWKLLYYIKDRDAYMSCHKYLLTLGKAGGWKGVHKICMNKAEVVKGHLSHLVFMALTESAMTSAGTGPVWWQKYHIVLYIGSPVALYTFSWPARVWMAFQSPPAVLCPVHLVSFSFFRFHLKCYFVTEAYADNFVVFVPLPPPFSLCKGLLSIRDNRLVSISELSKYHFYFLFSHGNLMPQFIFVCCFLIYSHFLNDSIRSVEAGATTIINSRYRIWGTQESIRKCFLNEWTLERGTIPGNFIERFHISGREISILSLH